MGTEGQNSFDLAAFAPKAYLIDMPPFTELRSVEPRTRVVEEISALLMRPGASGVLMAGLSGIGKTQLAALVYQHAEQLRISGNSMFSGQSIWLEMNATTTLADIVDALCRKLQRALPGAWNLAPSMLAQELFRLLNTLEHPCLIIFDQFEALLDARTGQARNIQDGIGALFQLLVHHPCRCRFLLVSRFAPWGMRAYSPLHLQEFEVPPLETHEGVALLRLWGVQGRRNDLEDAVKYCQGHAQALVCLQTVLRLDSNVDLPSLYHEVTHRQRWISNAACDFLEYCYMHRLSSAQRLLLRSFSIYRQPVPQTAVLEMLQLEDQALGMQVSPSRRAALDLLLSLKLLSPKPGQCYAVPPVVAEFIRTCFQQEYEQAFQKAHICAADYYARLARNKVRSSKDRRKRIDDICELIETIWHLCQAQSYEQAYKLLQEEHIYTTLRRWGESTVLREIYQQFLNWPEGITTTIYNESGEIAAMRGQAYEAQEYFTHALSLCSAEPPGEEQVTLLSNLGAVYRKLGQLEEAQSLYQKALYICENGTITAEAQGVLLNNLGNLLYERGCKKQVAEQVGDIEEYTLAISYYERALRLYQQADIPEEAVRTLNNLGQVYSICDRKEEARSCYHRALLLSQQIGARWAQAISLGHLGLLCREEANREQAQVYYEQALRIFHQIGSSWEEATLLRNLGNLYILSQSYDVALACFILARDIFIALQCPEQGKIPDWVENGLRLALDHISYEEWFQSVEQHAISLLEQTLHDAAPAASISSVQADNISARDSSRKSIEVNHGGKPMNHELHNKLVTALLKVPDIENFDTRTSLMIGIPNRESLPRSHSNSYTDLSQLVDSLAEMYLPNGTWALYIFIDNAASRLDGMRNEAQLKAFLRDLEIYKEQASSLPAPGQSGTQHAGTSYRSLAKFSTAFYSESKQAEVSRGPSQNQEIAIDRTALRTALLRAFRQKADLKILCADVTQVLQDQGLTDFVITLDMLDGDTLQQQMLSLIEELDQRGYLFCLPLAACKTRPHFSY